MRRIVQFVSQNRVALRNLYSEQEAELTGSARVPMCPKFFIMQVRAELLIHLTVSYFICFFKIPKKTDNSDLVQIQKCVPIVFLKGVGVGCPIQLHPSGNNHSVYGWKNVLKQQWKSTKYSGGVHDTQYQFLDELHMLPFCPYINHLSSHVK